MSLRSLNVMFIDSQFCEEKESFVQLKYNINFLNRQSRLSLFFKNLFKKNEILIFVNKSELIGDKNQRSLMISTVGAQAINS